MVYLQITRLSRRETKYTKPQHLSFHGHHFDLDHGFDGQVRSQRTHVLQPARDIFAHLRLPTTPTLSRTSVIESTKIVTTPQTPITREDLAGLLAYWVVPGT